MRYVVINLIKDCSWSLYLSRRIQLSFLRLCFQSRGMYEERVQNLNNRTIKYLLFGDVRESINKWEATMCT